MRRLTAILTATRVDDSIRRWTSPDVDRVLSKSRPVSVESDVFRVRQAPRSSGAGADQGTPGLVGALRGGLLSGWSIPTVFGAVPLNLWAPWIAARLLGLIPVHFFGLGPYGI